MSRDRRRPRGILTAALALACAVLLGACADGDAAWDARTLQQTVADAPFQPIIVNSNLGMGQNRFALALFDSNQEFVNAAEVKATFYHLDKEPEGEPTNPRLFAERVLTARTLKAVGAARPDTGFVSRQPSVVPASAVDAHVGHDSTVFTTAIEFDRAGFWGVALDVKTATQEHRGMRLVFAVQDRTLEPLVGEAAPRTKQLTLSDVKSIEEIDTSPTPNPELHRLTIEQAVTSGRPSVIAFVTPAFCQTRFCGPTLDQVVVPAWTEFRDRVNVLHVEPFDIGKARAGTLELVPAVKEWKILAEPMIFVVASDGTVAAKFEGIAEYAELRDAILATLSRK